MANISIEQNLLLPNSKAERWAELLNEAEFYSLPYEEGCKSTEIYSLGVHHVASVYVAKPLNSFWVKLENQDKSFAAEKHSKMLEIYKALQNEK